MTLYLSNSLTWSHTVIGFALNFNHKILYLIKHRVLEIYRVLWNNGPSTFSSLKRVAESWEGVWASVRVCAQIHWRVGGVGGTQGFSNNAVRTHSTLHPAPPPNSPPSLFSSHSLCLPLPDKILTKGLAFSLTTNSTENIVLVKLAHVFIKRTL